MTSVIVSSAGSGIGATTALQLDRHGVRVFAGVHDPRDGEVLARQASRSLSVAPLDVTDLRSVKAFVAGVDERLAGAGVSALVNTSGESVAGPLETLPLDLLRHQFEVQVIGQVALTQQALPLLRREPAPGGRVVFVGSMGGLMAGQFAGALHAAKEAMEAIGDAWRQELAPDGIHVVLIEPGRVATPLWAKAARTIDALPASERYRERLSSFRESLRHEGWDGTVPQQIADLIEEAVTAERPRTRYAPGIAATVLPRVRRLVPDRMADRIARHGSTRPG